MTFPDALFRIPQEGGVNEDIHRLYPFSSNKGGSGTCFLLLITLWEGPTSTDYIHTHRGKPHPLTA